MLCCWHMPGRGVGDDNLLLDNEVQPHDDAMPADHNPNLDLLPSPAVIEEFEGVTQHIIETISQMDGFSVGSIQHTLTSCMNLIPSQHVRLFILGHLLDINAKTNKLNTLRSLVATLDAAQRDELATIVTGLPPSVLGDLQAKEATRVLVDLLVDTKECAQIDKLRVVGQKKFVDTTIEMLQQTMASLHTTDRENVLFGVLQTQLPALKMKITLKYLVFSRCLQPDQSARAEFMQQLLTTTM